MLPHKVIMFDREFERVKVRLFNSNSKTWTNQSPLLCSWILCNRLLETNGARLPNSRSSAAQTTRLHSQSADGRSLSACSSPPSIYKCIAFLRVIFEKQSPSSLPRVRCYYIQSSSLELCLRLLILLSLVRFLMFISSTRTYHQMALHGRAFISLFYLTDSSSEVSRQCRVSWRYRE